jgi:NADH:ubiquinone oxidoreductase subunit F (NADH-binding)
MHDLLPDTPIGTYGEYLDRAGGSAISLALDIGPEDIVSRVRASGLRGRGGGGFPTGIKWEGVARADGPSVVVCNAAEGEPGTRKDRALMESNPYAVLEGVVVAAIAVDAPIAYIGVKDKFGLAIERLTEAAEEMREVADVCEMSVVEGPDDYLFGVETAMLEVIEGRDPLPRIEPPYVRGIIGRDGRESATVVNNVETLANVPGIVLDGPQRYRTVGTEQSPGTMVFTITGDVVSPGTFELPLGTPLSILVHGSGGGCPEGRRPKLAVSGVSNRPLSASEFDTPMSFEDMASIGSGLGAGGYIVYDDTTCVVEVGALLSGFLQIGSCGQCPPCKLGTTALTDGFGSILDRRGSLELIEEMVAWTSRVTDANRCGLGAGQRNLAIGILQTFTDDVVACMEGRCPGHRGLVPPMLI